MIVMLLFNVLLVAVMVWLVTTLSAIRRHTARTVELLERTATRPS